MRRLLLVLSGLLLSVPALAGNVNLINGQASPAPPSIPSEASSCGLGLSAVQANTNLLVACLDANTPKSDWENFSLAVLGPKLWPGNQAAIDNARAWISQVDADLIGGMGLGVPYTGTATDVANWRIIRNANYSGGTPGFVNSAFRADTKVGPSATAFEWAILGTVDSQATGGENVGVYGQGYGRSSGPIWGMVAEAHAFGSGNAVGLEVDTAKANGSTAKAIGVDAVNYGNMDVAYRCPNDVPCLSNPMDPTSYILFPSSGGIRIVAHGQTVQSW